MKKIINHFICLCRGHKWEILSTIYKSTIVNGTKRIVLKQCARCGKIKEEVI